MGRPASDLDDYLDWQERLENYKASGLEVEVFCLQEGVSRTTFYKWAGRLKDGIPESMVAEKAARERAESGQRCLCRSRSLSACIHNHAGIRFRKGILAFTGRLSDRIESH